ncbi:MAG: RnfABCDGE type electron transport complex subunit D [Planctomycetes bacterium]|nr:RnfABCDGE type electron transport complex subunit D [Planctomycetota bacterium]MCB9909043.1 RnfABCDGE type electron transport complex subunit D [Planctomycetota bacterium]MCB9911712.1 RnfABCDGE type electron transport complex subunit D [Planctomycetota bacterium]HPF13664.1 hypothetical protein [Planctomycetota bacterium]HRV79952.1 hypothetical protein [Planctomycetota bacterium]
MQNDAKSPNIFARLTPKHLVVILITTILVVGEWQYHVIGGYPRLVVALGVCMLTELVLSMFVLGRRVPLLSAYVSGTSLTLLLKPEAGLIWPFVVGAMLSILSKYVLRWRGRHLWNPTNCSICLLLLVAAPVTAILSHEWSNQLATNLLLWAYGLVVVSRAKVLHVTLAYAASFALFAALRGWMHAEDARTFASTFNAEIGPLTGPMYQLFCFFMVTDPPTTVSTKRGRIFVAFLVALAEHLIRVGVEDGVSWLMPFAPAPALFALFFVGPVAMVVSLEWNAHRAKLAGRSRLAPTT